MFPIPLGAYDGSPAGEYMAREIVLPDDGATYTLHLPLSEGDTLKSLYILFNLKGKARVSVGGTSALVGDGEVVVGYEGGRWYVSRGKSQRELEGRPPDTTVRLKVVPEGMARLVGETLSVRLEYSGEPIVRVRVGDILDSPKAYAGKRVLLVVSPGGWGCPVGRGTPLPSDLSRSATTLYDPTGCIYGTGRIVAGRFLSPEAHPVYRPGREVVVVVGRVRLAPDGVPYLVPDGQ